MEFIVLINCVFFRKIQKHKQWKKINHEIKQNAFYHVKVYSIKLNEQQQQKRTSFRSKIFSVYFKIKFKSTFINEIEEFFR